MTEAKLVAPKPPWNKEQPVMLYVRELIRRYAAEVGTRHDKTLSKRYSKEIHNHPAAGVGGFVPRPSKHGKFSRHSEGRGCDIYVNVDTPLLKEFGDRLFDGLAANAAELGIEDLIWDDKVWTDDDPYVHHYADTDHRNHLHVGFSRKSSQFQKPLLEEIIRSAMFGARMQFAGDYEVSDEVLVSA